MTLYEMPAKSPYQRPFRIFAAVAVILLLVTLCISIWTPSGLSDETRKMLAWIASAIVLAGVVAGYWLAFKLGFWRLKQGYRVELSDGNVIQSRSGSPTVEIPLDQIASIEQSRGGWLIVRGCDPERRIAIPSEIVGFDGLKRELSANRTVSPLKIKHSRWLFLPSASFVIACIFLFVAHSRAVVLAAGGAALLLEGLGIVSLRRALRSSRRANLITLIYVMTFLMLVWIVYERAASRF
jgi:hypothetical protein